MASQTQPWAWPGGNRRLRPSSRARRPTGDEQWTNRRSRPGTMATSDVAPRGEPRLSWDCFGRGSPPGTRLGRRTVHPRLVRHRPGRLLVSSGGGPHGRSVWLYRPIGAPEHGSPPCYDAGVRVPELDGLRCLCPIPNDRPSRFDLVAIGRRRARGLAQRGLLERTGLRPQGRSGAGRGPGDPARANRPDDGRRLGPGWADRPAGGCPRPDRLLARLGPAPARSAGWPQSERRPSLLRSPRGCGAAARPSGHLFWLRNVGRAGEPRFELQPEITGESGRAGHRPSSGPPGGFLGRPRQPRAAGLRPSRAA